MHVVLGLGKIPILANAQEDIRGRKASCVSGAQFMPDWCHPPFCEPFLALHECLPGWADRKGCRVGCSKTEGSSSCFEGCHDAPWCDYIRKLASRYHKGCVRIGPKIWPEEILVGKTSEMCFSTYFAILSSDLKSVCPKVHFFPRYQISWLWLSTTVPKVSSMQAFVKISSSSAISAPNNAILGLLEMHKWGP